VWDQERSLAFAPVDPATGELSTEAMFITTTSTLSAFAAHTTANGFLLSWAERSGLYRTFVSIGGQTPSPQLLPIAWDKRSEYISSDIYAGSSHYLAISSYSDDRTRIIELGEDGKVFAST